MYNEDMVELYHVTWRPQAIESFGTVDPLHPVPAPHASALAYLGTVKTPSKPAGAYRPPGARGTATPVHFKREDEGGAAHIVSNGTSHIGQNGFGSRPRRQIPGAETVDNLPPGAAPASGPVSGTATEGDENLSKAALKNKKKREAKKAKEAEAKATGSAGLTPTPDKPSVGNENRSPERRNRREHQRTNSADQRDTRNPSQQRRERSHTNQGRYNGLPTGPSGISTPNMKNLTINSAQTAISSRAPPPPPELSVTSPTGGSPNAKKLRGLQKKIRAIEDLEMRLAGGEKLEDTQMKKIATKSSVQAELNALEQE